jgi:hypothetical protein
MPFPMTEPLSARRFGVVLLAVLTACSAAPTPSPTPTVTPTAAPSPSSTSSAPTSAAASPSASASPPPLSLEPPSGNDPRVVDVAVDPQVDENGGQIRVRITSSADERVDELVLRWPTELDATLFLAPFTPSEERIRDGGPPLVQEWTKWVVGPGEQGEPSGTTSLGWGPLPAGGTLEIPIVVTRREPGPVAFDLQVLAGNDLLALADGRPAQLRVEVP